MLPITVVIPAYNREQLLGQALRSIAAQQPDRPAEVIVVDDCSTDDSAAVAERLGARVVEHDHNQGAAAARNTGIRAARQPWIALLDSDDIWDPDHLATLWPLRADHVLVAGAAMAVGEDPSDRRYAGALDDEPMVIDSPARIAFPENIIPASGVLARRDDILALGGFDTSLRYAEDFDLWLRLLERGTGLAVPRVTYTWSRHEGSKSAADEGPRAAHRQIIASHSGRPWWTRSLAEKRNAVAEWDDFRLALRKRRLGTAARSVAWFAGHPSRPVGVAQLLAFRRRTRARTAVEQRRRAGTLTVAPLPGPVDSAPYLSSLHGALAGQDVRTVEPPSARAALVSEADVVHLHWLEYLVRPATADGPRARAVAWLRAMRLLTTLLRLRRSGKAVVWTAHNLRPHEPRQPRLEWLLAWAVSRSVDAVIAHSAHAASRLAETYGIPAADIEVISHGHFGDLHPAAQRSREQVRTKLGIPEDAFTYLVFGQLRAYKNVPAAIAAFRRLGDDRPVRMVVAGNPHDDAIRRDVERAAEDDSRVILELAHVPDEQIAELHTACDALVLPYREIFSSGALLLAFSHGLPAVVPDAGGDEIEPARAVETFASGRIDGAMRAIAAGDQAQRRQAAADAAGRAAWEPIAARTRGVYARALGL